MDKQKLLEMLQEMKEVAQAQGNTLTKDEVKKYLGEENLSEETLQAVYHYLGENQISVEGYTYIPSVEENEEVVEKSNRRDENMRLYEKELMQFPKEIKEETIKAFLKGDANAKEEIITGYLHQVVQMAKVYEKRKVALDEVIAEGNLGLMMGMQSIALEADKYFLDKDNVNVEGFFGTLQLEIKKAMEQYIDEITSSKDWESAMLAKTNLLHEATKYLTEELGRIPTVNELADYTKIGSTEIRSIMGISKDTQRVASDTVPKSFAFPKK